ncbi:hypothetical protein EHYA_01402 [Embleya hyalina]|uniref:Uncharacterized protein n=1 Tax=Embleya hyalina TaxID=516124 RepID=A0A401YGL1_9ACTN|nr:hypothetical protein EHYA_01402 [Embleya hyalina]
MMRGVSESISEGGEAEVVCGGRGHLWMRSDRAGAGYRS